MAIDPNIALGVRPIELPNQLAQYGQLAAIQNAQNQNALAQYQLSSAQRADLAQTDLSDAYKRSINPETGAIDKTLLLSNVAKSRAAHLLPEIQSKLLEAESKQATLNKTQQETKAGEFKLTQDKLKHGWMSMGEASTPQDAIAKLQDGVKQGYFDFATAQKEAMQLQNMTPDQYKQYRIQKIMGLLDAKDQLGAMLPKNVRQDIGGKIVNIQDNPMLPGYGLPVAGMDIAKTATIADNLAAAKFAWEKANPNQTIHEDANGLLAVNNRTGVATPVVYGPMGIQPAGTPTAAAPSASIMRQPPAAMPGQRAPAILGMASVLDQTGAPAVLPVPAEGGARVPGMPVGGKDKALTESQGAAATYGMRMKEANSILARLEKTGVKNTGLISGTVGGVVGLVPLIGDKLEGATGSLFNSLPQILGGLSPEQQQVAQARINFITAVLRKESGASISPAEFSTAEKNYFPKPGDSESTIAQKQKARETAIKAMEIQAGPGAKYIQQHQPNVGAAPTVSNW